MKLGAVLAAGLLAVAAYLMTTEDAVAEQKSDTVLSIGLHPSAVDYSRYPQIDEATLTARIAAGETALREAGFDIVTCQVPADPDAAEATLRDCAAGRPFGVAMIGAGVRMAPEHTLLFERLINVATEIAPGIRFCFNTSPETTIDALRRGLHAR
ncbi:hypothetical protein [Nocardia ignorata]|uniref:Uncharacterized protein n=1 Tax=Nocardia ignorata TaxID=145285 RepID=A0A4R6PVW0_NOCIG|nr:hypothetical protein [Nocardia ignorata]TDP42290.1 hypothetical protein DFR75_1011400 [Nocardia ignorata]